MRKLTKAIALCLSLVLLMSFPVAASAADHDYPTETPESIIDTSAKGALTLYKYDLTGGATRS